MRIASLLPAATEIVTALGAADQLVAVTFECAEEARERCPAVVDTAIPPGLSPAEIDAWVRDRVALGLPMYELDRTALAALQGAPADEVVYCEECGTVLVRQVGAR